MVAAGTLGSIWIIHVGGLGMVPSDGLMLLHEILNRGRVGTVPPRLPTLGEVIHRY